MKLFILLLTPHSHLFTKIIHIIYNACTNCITQNYIFELNNSFISTFYLALFKTCLYYVLHKSTTEFITAIIIWRTTVIIHLIKDVRCSVTSIILSFPFRFLSNNLFVHFTQCKCHLATTYNYSCHSLKRKSVEHAFLYTLKMKHIVQNALTHPT